MVQIVLSLQGLGTKLQACGIITNPNELQAFGRAFGLAQPLFSFIDCGTGKERADHKIRETLRLFLPMAQCKHVFFGPCHDNGYLPVLEQYKGDKALASRLTLIETRPAEHGFMDLGFKLMRLEKLFRSTDLPGRPAAFSVASPNGAGSRTMSSMQPSTPSFLPPPPLQNNGVPLKASTSRSSSTPSTDSSWATIGKSGATDKTFNIAPKKQAAKPYIVLNVHDDRLDADLPKQDPQAVQRYNDRYKLKGKFCNNYHLTGRCQAGTYCDYQHGEKLSSGELLVLKHKARNLKCPKQGRCRNFECQSGHHCRFGDSCFFDICNFMDTHGMDNVGYLQHKSECIWAKKTRNRRNACTKMDLKSGCNLIWTSSALSMCDAGNRSALWRA